MNKSLIIRVVLLLVVGAALLTLAGCRESQDPSQEENPDINVDLQMTPDPAVVGESTLVITVTDAEQAPIQDATITVRGDMNHAGMVPVVRQGEAITQESPGVYTTPFDWTMGGDWIVVVTVTLPDNSAVEETFELTINGDGAMEMGEMEMAETTPADAPDLENRTPTPGGGEADNG